uniref:Tub domain-containing protein n=1 Tax=Bursaphelenchus xylophilus TaxID=6326 RepID=A0A1I7S1C4_BURXY
MSSGIIAMSDTRGLLASGTQNGVVGIAVTDTALPESFSESDLSRRYNYNLRGHHAKIQRVAWNSTMTKLGSCDENGVIYVWVPNEERWSVELVNDRGLKVRDFDWSPNGAAALILYEDNFVLIGSASGQRIWSNTFLNQVNCGTWSPNSKELVLGLETGQIQVFNDQGTIITERQLLQVGVFKLAFSPIREDEEEHQKWTLAAVSMDDQILFLNTQYEVELYGWKSRDPIRSIHWSSSGKMLSVVCSTGRIVILNQQGRPIHSFLPPIMFDDEPTVFTWAHKDEMVIIAAGSTLAVGRVSHGVPPLTELVSYQLWLGAGRTGRFANRLKLPQRPTSIIKQFDRHVIRCRVPSYDKMCRFVCEPTFWRWYCTIMPIPRKSYQYMLCVEHLGGMIPVLIGRQINRVIPQFLISLPPSTAYTTPGYSYGPWAIKDHSVGPRWSYAADCNVNLPMPNYSFTHDLEPMPPSGIEDPSETSGYAQTIAKRKLQEDILLAHQPEPRNSVWRRSKRRIKKFMSKRLANPIVKSNRVLCHVSSNVWCTRFKITSPGIRDLPPTLAHVVYKTSVLHLQPRQMGIALCDLRPLTKTLPLPLDFGGRVTQESAKNFQIEHESEQVMQFGRIENGAYTLDFCTPLSAVQAFGIALASITQRLK